nr:hypothetical protein [Tanacetum cinerariifolium]
MYPNKGKKKAKTGLNIEEGNFNKLDDLVSKGDDYAINEGRSTDKIKVLNVEAEGVSAAGETLSTATLAFTMSNRHQELASPKQTALGKDFSNPLMADSLPKTIWLSMHHVIAMKHWLFQSKRLLTDCLRMLKMTKYQMSSSLSKSILENNKVFGYILQVIKTPKLKKHEGKDYAQNVKNQSKTGQYRTQDLKSTPKARSTSSFSTAISQ